MVHSSKMQPIRAGRQGGRSVRQLVTLRLQPGAAEREGCWYSAHFLLFIQSRPLTYGMMAPVFREGLLPQLTQYGYSLTDPPTSV